jgi:UDP-3-O-[3-hydroxymyristoyl] glucosamine N-acyltransferase
VIGADGFGFAPFEGRWIKIPQIGAVEIGDDVDIGANTTIDRGALGDTVIGRGCQIGGAAMIGGHLTIAGGTLIGPASAVASSVERAGHYTGFFPLMTHRDWGRNAAIVRRLDRLRDRVRRLAAGAADDASE